VNLEGTQNQLKALARHAVHEADHRRTAADEETAFAVQGLLAARWGIAPADRTTREPGEPGVRLRCFLDLRQQLDSEHQAEGELDPVTG
jgi:hypothetical protein